MRVRTFLLSNATTIGSYVLCLLLFLAATVYSPGFANPAHLRQLVVFASFVGFAALGKLKGHAGSLWRGVALDLRGQYPQGGTVVWVVGPESARLEGRGEGLPDDGAHWIP